MAELDEAAARELDSSDPLARFRERYAIPRGADGEPVAYFCGNSLGLQPRRVAAALEAELEAWARLAVDAHFEAEHPWYSYHEPFREPLARLVGAEPREVVAMNGLTANLHLMMASFYRPEGRRRKILTEAAAFPSDGYAVQSQIAWHGHDPQADWIEARPREGEALLRTDDVEALLAERGAEIALVLFGGVSYYSGQLLDMQRIAAAARDAGCAVGFDLAHAAGNVPLRLHDWNADFAVWCSYKYLNAGPGAVAGCFVHARHAERPDLPRLAGWWGNDPATRFRMHLERGFVPQPGADGWQLSNPPILALAPLRAALADFDEAGLPALREKSVALTAYLERWIDRVAHPGARILTPREPQARGAQLSLELPGEAEALFEALHAHGIVCDLRKPDVVRVAPVPLYNTFHDVWRFGRGFEAWSASRRS